MRLQNIGHSFLFVVFVTVFVIVGFAVVQALLLPDIPYLRDRLHAPIVWDREAGGYRFAAASPAGPAYALPGLWFSAGEIYALLAAHQLLADLEPGILAAQVAPLQARLVALLEASGHTAGDIAARVRLVPLARRPVAPRNFADVAYALLERRCLEIDAWHRGRNEVNTRTISPQRLVHYRDNWYVDAWCHWRQALRSFSLDALQRVAILQEPAREVSTAVLDDHFSRAYGIFAGPPMDWAVLRFSAERARWVGSERWHRDQAGETLPDGSYRLQVPFADPRELLMDILRHGRQVEVEAPPALRRLVAEEVAALAALYPAVPRPGAGAVFEPPPG